MDPAAGRDFFISYTGVNRSWAEWIAVQLEGAGFTTLLQAFDFRPGTDFVQLMQQATSTAKRTIAVLSPAYFGSKFGAAEWQAAFAKDPSGELGLLLPVRVQPCDPPGLLANKVYVDLVDFPEGTCRRLLLDAVNQNWVRPKEVPFPGAPNGAGPSARFPGAGPAVSNLPPRNRNFAGRGHLLDRMHADLQTASAAAVVPTEAVHGLGGIGKTELATEYAHRFGSDYDIAWWIPAEEPTTAAAALAGLARRLRIPEAADRAETVAALFDALRDRDRWLLVYDNAEQPDQLAGLLPPGGGGHVLVTSRWQAWGRHATPLRLGVLARPESIAFLQQRIGADDPAGLDAVADLLGDLPLALEEAGAYLEETGDSVQNYRGLVRDRAGELFDRDRPAAGGHADQRRVGTVWSLSLDRVRHQEPAAEALLNLCAFLAPDIPRDFPTEAPEVLPADLGVAVVDPLAYNRILAVIARYSLVILTPATASLHRLVQAVIRAQLDPERERDWTRAATNLVRDRFPDVCETPATWPECERLLPHALVVTEHAERLGVAEEQAGWLLDRASTYLRVRGQSRQAKPLAERAVTLTESSLGLGHPEVAWRCDELGVVLESLGDLDGARAQYTRALRISLAEFGLNHADVGRWRTKLGRVLGKLGDLDGARMQLERAVRIGEVALGPDHRDVGAMRAALGNVFWDLGDPDVACAQLVQAVRIGDAEPDEPEIIGYRHCHGRMLRALDDLPGARAELELAVRIGEATLGSNHPYLGAYRKSLGILLRDLDDLIGARAQLERAVRMAEESHVQGPNIIACRYNLGLVLWDLGDLDGARAELERAVQIGQAALGQDNVDTTYRTNLGVVLRAVADLPGTRSQVNLPNRIGESLRQQSAEGGTYRDYLDVVLKALKNLPGARARLEQALSIGEAALGQGHPDIGMVRAGLQALELLRRRSRQC